MKIMKKTIISISLLALLLSIFSGCVSNTQNDELTSKGKSSGVYFSTETKIIVYDDFTKQANLDKFDGAWEDCKAIVEKIDALCSPAVATSDLVQFNNLKFGQSMGISEITAKILQIAKEDFELTDGLFDPTIYPLVDLWGFTPRFSDFNYVETLPYDRTRVDGSFPFPEKKYIDGFLKLVDFSNIILTFDEVKGYTLTKNIKDVVIDGQTYSAKIDLGGIAKGYAVEQMNKILRAAGYEYGYISCGSSSMALFKSYTDKENMNYDLGVTKPREGLNDTTSMYAKIKIKDASLSSSGDYEHNYQLDGKNYCHIINPKTGYPINTSGSTTSTLQVGIAVVTLLGGTADYDDGLTTAMTLMSLEDLIAFVEQKLPTRKFILTIYKQDETLFEVVTNIDKSLITFLDDAYKLSSKIENGKVIYTGEYLK